MKNIKHITAMESMLRESLASIAISIAIIITCTRAEKSTEASLIVLVIITFAFVTEITKQRRINYE